MSAYVPEHVYGLIPGSYGEYGLVPWPKHMTPRGADEEPRESGANAEPVSSGVEITKKGEAYVAAALAEADGVFFLTVDGRDRQSIATSIDRLINMLDDLEPDPDVEPWLGAPEPGHSGSQERAWRVPHADDREEGDGDLEPSLGNGGSFVAGELQYDLELDTSDAEHSSGWQNTGDQTRLLWGDEEQEPNGDELDYSGNEDDSSTYSVGNCDGSGVSEAERLLQRVPRRRRDPDQLTIIGPGVAPLGF